MQVHGAKPAFQQPATDAPEELFAMLLYFRRPEDDSTGGDLEIWQWKDGRRPAFIGSEANEEGAELVATIPYRPNTLTESVLSGSLGQSSHCLKHNSVGEEHGAVAHLVCVEQSVDGAASALERGTGMSAPEMGEVAKSHRRNWPKRTQR
ncbi:hypothetical protein, partial [Flavobacterium sp.]|uniref:hypothetical protein n=1 Tax=Flavobacterium sp. TaxID=239 RepID=UPI003C3720CD